MLPLLAFSLTGPSIPIAVLGFSALIAIVVLYFQSRERWHQTAPLAIEKGQPPYEQLALWLGGAAPLLAFGVDYETLAGRVDPTVLAAWSGPGVAAALFSAVSACWAARAGYGMAGLRPPARRWPGAASGALGPGDRRS